jgi:hypothetical protein
LRVGCGVDAFLVEFGAVDRAVLDVLFDRNLPTTPAGYVYGGRLPRRRATARAQPTSSRDTIGRRGRSSGPDAGCPWDLSGVRMIVHTQVPSTAQR